MGTAIVRANVRLSGWKVGEERTVELTDQVLRRAANGLFTIVSATPEDERRFVPSDADPDVAGDPLPADPLKGLFGSLSGVPELPLEGEGEGEGESAW